MNTNAREVSFRRHILQQYIPEDYVAL